MSGKIFKLGCYYIFLMLQERLFIYSSKQIFIATHLKRNDSGWCIAKKRYKIVHRHTDFFKKASIRFNQQQSHFKIFPVPCEPQTWWQCQVLKDFWKMRREGVDLTLGVCVGGKLSIKQALWQRSIFKYWFDLAKCSSLRDGTHNKPLLPYLMGGSDVIRERWSLK